MEKKEYPRILVGVVTYKGKDYIFDECMKSIKNFDYPVDKYDTVIVDNTRDGGRYSRALKKRGYPRVERVSRGANSREALNKSQNLVRKRCIEGGYDYLLMVESDLTPPPDTIKRLLSHNKKVVGSTYIIGTKRVRIPCIFLSFVDRNGVGRTRALGQTVNEKGQRTSTDYNEIREFLNRPNKLQKVHGCGLGCTLIHKDIVTEFPFWTDSRREDAHSDVFFYLDLQRNNIPVYVDISTIVPHYPTDWDDVEDR